MVKTKFYEDKRKEELFGLWLDKHFYSQLEGKYKSIERCYDENMQKKGVDVIVETSQGKKIYIDEKATLHYINKRIPTFAFEIRNDTSGAQGWLYNPKYITNYYILAWPNATDDSIPNVDAFTATEVMSIKRESVIKLLADHGLTESEVKKMIPSYYSRLHETNKFEVADGITLNFNTFLHERPINLVVEKWLLQKYAQYSKIIG